ncbi:hypothetical protein ACIO1C_03875 [Streptomyces sp. NPDC087420]
MTTVVTLLSLVAELPPGGMSGAAELCLAMAIVILLLGAQKE